MNSNLASIACISLVLVSCSGGGGDGDQTSPPPAPPTAAEQLMKLEAEGKIPKLNRGPDIAGPDLNSNGVRDDIDAYITSRGLTAAEAAAATQVARGFQATLLVDTTDPVEVKQVALNMTRGLSCLEEKASTPNIADSIFHDLQKYTTNTKVRLKAYLKFNIAMNGTVGSSPAGGTCE